MLLDGPERRRSVPPGPRRPQRARADRPLAVPRDESGAVVDEEPGFVLPPLVDQYGLGVSHADIGLGAFESHLAAAVGSRGPAAPGTTFFDSWLGLAVRRWCPPLLGVEPHCTPAHYLAARRAHGAYQATRLLLRGCGVGAYLLAAGAVEAPLSAAELASATGVPAYEIVSVRALAGQVADGSHTARGFLAATVDALAGAPARRAVALAIAPGPLPARPPDARAVREAAERWLRARARGARPSDPVLLHHLLWSALTTGLPIQLHCPEPDRVADFLAATVGLGTDLVLLPGHGGHRSAARLAATFPHVYADVGPAPRETLRLAPFGKLLFSTGARGLPELYVVAARQFAVEMTRLADEWCAEGVCTPPQAQRIADLVASGTARRVYRLPAGAGSSAPTASPGRG
ncbi:amidohydrolase [Streptomyces sp. 71268]|uniref:amidohydrolase n=1 Tax=Streptomyces sp. 71268 TaxID=3002640 RepID=UPI0023F9F57C|nr:amidohydrolase [Streptomyces sp. 71268]WEV28440.1 amidohydrolase [Streptomyces sp. 71268]